MKKKLLCALTVAVLGTSLFGCNKTVIDTTYKFTDAVVRLQNGEII